MQDQYSGYEAVPGVKLNGALTSGENIADIGGVKLGYAALQAWEKAHPEEHRAVEGFSDEQLFFLAYAQGWCSKETPSSSRCSPARTRTRRRSGASTARWPTCRRSREAYQCKAGTPMNSGKVCSVW